MIRLSKPFLPIAALAALLLFGAACGSGTQELDPMSLTLTQMSASVRGTATARAVDMGSGDELATNVARVTEQAGLVFGTQTAVATLNEPARLATTTAIAPALAELPRYGIDSAQGYVAWLHTPVTIALQGDQQNGTANEYQSFTASDFILAADISWNMLDSTSRCGFMFRSNGDVDQPSQYLVLLSRLAGGSMTFLSLTDGKVTNLQTFYPQDKDSSFNWFNGATNRAAVVARSSIIDLYTNGMWIGQVDLTQPPPSQTYDPPAFDLPPGATAEQVQDFNNQVVQIPVGMGFLNAQLSQAQENFPVYNSVLTDGFLGFIAMNQSGNVTCTFDNAWLFVIKR